MQADYLFKPWVMAIMRWDQVNSSADRINGLEFATNTPYFAPYNSTRDRFTPGIQFLIHPNIKLSFEYQIRPQQFVALSTLPNGNPVATHPFRVNTALYRARVCVLTSREELIHHEKRCSVAVPDSGMREHTLRRCHFRHRQPGKAASVVYIEAVAGKTFPAPQSPLAMDQKSLLFQPHVMAVQLGTTVEFLNSDKVQHNIFWPVHQRQQEDEPQHGNLADGRGARLQIRYRGRRAACCATCIRRCRDTSSFLPLRFMRTADAREVSRSMACRTATYTVAAWHEGMKISPNR